LVPNGTLWNAYILDRASGETITVATDARGVMLAPNTSLVVWWPNTGATDGRPIWDQALG
jgi:hypothetical protein